MAHSTEDAEVLLAHLPTVFCASWVAGLSGAGAGLGHEQDEDICTLVVASNMSTLGVVHVTFSLIAIGAGAVADCLWLLFFLCSGHQYRPHGNGHTFSFNVCDRFL